MNERLAALRRLLDERGLDAVLLSAKADVRYLWAFAATTPSCS